MIFLRRGVAARAIEAEAGIAHGIWRLVAVGRLPLPNLCPVPTVLRSLSVLDHDRPVRHLLRRGQLILRRRWRVLLFDDHRAVLNHALSIMHQPFHDLRRIIDLHRRVDAQRDFIDEGAGIAQPLIGAPV